jgi:hypothetical protein
MFSMLQKMQLTYADKLKLFGEHAGKLGLLFRPAHLPSVIAGPGGCLCFGAIDQTGIWDRRGYPQRGVNPFPGRLGALKIVYGRVSQSLKLFVASFKASKAASHHDCSLLLGIEYLGDIKYLATISNLGLICVKGRPRLAGYPDPDRNRCRVGPKNRHFKMPLYHLHIVKGREKVDPRVVELPDDESAVRRAHQLASALTTLSRGFGVRILDGCHIDVTDAGGKSIARCDVSIGTTLGRSRVQQRVRA